MGVWLSCECAPSPAVKPTRMMVRTSKRYSRVLNSLEKCCVCSELCDKIRRGDNISEYQILRNVLLLDVLVRFSQTEVRRCHGDLIKAMDPKNFDLEMSGEVHVPVYGDRWIDDTKMFSNEDAVLTSLRKYRRAATDNYRQTCRLRYIVNIVSLLRVIKLGYLLNPESVAMALGCVQIHYINCNDTRSRLIYKICKYHDTEPNSTISNCFSARFGAPILDGILLPPLADIIASYLVGDHMTAIWNYRTSAPIPLDICVDHA